ncbi:MAG: GNAT family N-acetyltransferase [Chloroflexota bacterium]|nr:GNAT family N-acetyltransferase [Chloroflexota bacterium]
MIINGRRSIVNGQSRLVVIGPGDNVLETERLSLVPLMARQLALYRDCPVVLEKELGLALSRSIMTDRVRWAIGMKLDKMSQVGEGDHCWFTYWLMVIDESSFGAGLAGFKGLPDAHGAVEISCGIDVACRGKGYTTEAVMALIAWAFSAEDCMSVFASVDRENMASSRVLEIAGMLLREETVETLLWRIEKPVS